MSHWRELFAELTNRHLEKHGFADRIDHRSYKDQGIDLEATQHEGHTLPASQTRYRHRNQSIQ